MHHSCYLNCRTSCARGKTHVLKISWCLCDWCVSEWHRWCLERASLLNPAAGWKSLATRQLWLQRSWALQLTLLWQAGDVGFWLICVSSGWPGACLYVVWALQDVWNILCASSLGVRPLLQMLFCFCHSWGSPDKHIFLAFSGFCHLWEW